MNWRQRIWRCCSVRKSVLQHIGCKIYNISAIVHVFTQSKWLGMKRMKNCPSFGRQSKFGIRNYSIRFRILGLVYCIVWMGEKDIRWISIDIPIIFWRSIYEAYSNTFFACDFNKTALSTMFSRPFRYGFRTLFKEPYKSFKYHSFETLSWIVFILAMQLYFWP